MSQFPAGSTGPTPDCTLRTQQEKYYYPKDKPAHITRLIL